VSVARAALALLIAMTVARPAQAASVTVTVSGIRDNRGVVRVAICPRADFLKPRCPYFALSPSEAGSVTVTINGVPPGVYAAQAYQDANDNSILDRNWLGLPKEGMGFSRDAPMRFGPPSFADADFTLGAADAAIAFRLRYFTPP
jgi:uncharacterized protein (DUF2141 family)